MELNRDKRTEEMFNDLCEADKEFYQFCRGKRCQECEYYYSKRDCKNKIYAEKLTEKGYRKASDLAEEIFAEIEKMLLDNHIGHYKTTIDTWCYNFNNEIISEIAELKKKYTEEGK